MTVTKARLDQLEAEHPTLNPERHYTIGGAVETTVHSNVEAERIGELTQGHRVMNKAVQDFKTNMAFKTREGLARGQFKAAQFDNSTPIEANQHFNEKERTR